MNKIFKKLRSRAGESLMESLAAIVIFTLASLVMYSMVTAAADINMTAKEKDRAVQEQMVVAEQAENSAGSGTINMYIIDAAGNEKSVSTVEVDIYGEDGDLYSYFTKEGGAG